MRETCCKEQILILSKLSLGCTAFNYLRHKTSTSLFAKWYDVNKFFYSMINYTSSNIIFLSSQAILLFEPNAIQIKCSF